MAITLNIDYNTKDATASLEKLKKTTQDALNSSASNVQKLGLQLQKTTQTIESTQAQMQKLADTKIVNPEYKKTIRDINDVNKALKDVESRMSDMRSTGSAYNDYYKQMESDLDSYKKKQDELFESINTFKQAGYSIHDPKVKEHLLEVAKYEGEINELKNKLSELRNTEQGYTTKYKDAIAEAKQYETVIDELRQKKGSFESSGTTTISGVNTSQYSKLSDTLDNATARANILVNAIEKLNGECSSAGTNIEKPFNDLALTSEKVTRQIGILPKIFAKIRSSGVSTASTISSSFKRAGNSIKDSISKGVEDSQQKLKGLGKGILKYVIGVRSLFLLYRKIREAGKEAFINLGNQFPEIQSQLDSLSASFGQLKNSIATAFQPIFSVAVPALVTLMNYLVSAMNTLANFFATLTGQKYIYKATKSVNNMNKAIGGSGSAAKEANKQLAEYDKLIVIPQDTNGGGGGGGGGGDATSNMFEKVPVEKYSGRLLDFFEPFKKSWEKYGQEVIDSWKYALESIWALSLSVADSFLAVWTNGTGEKFLGNILQITADIGKTIGNIANQFKKAWETNKVGQNIIQGTFDILNAVLDMIHEVTSATEDWASKLDFYPLLESVSGALDGILSAIQPILDLGVVLWETVILPVGSFLLESLIPALITLATDCLNLIGQVLEWLAPKFSWLISNVISPIAGALGQGVITILNTIHGVLSGNLKSSLDTIFKFLDGTLFPLLKTILKFLTATVVAGINLVVDVIQTAVNLIDGILGGLKQVLSGVIDFVVGVFTGDWSRAWDGVCSIFKGIWNTIVSIAEGAMNFVIRAVNAVISGLNALSFDVPDWVPGIGGSKFGFNIPSVSEVSLPRLAQGAVIPPNKEFLAVLGDQKQGTNIETPLDTMIQAFKIAFNEVGGNSSNNAPIVLQLNGKEVAEVVWDEEEKRYKQTGSYRPQYGY